MRRDLLLDHADQGRRTLLPLIASSIAAIQTIKEEENNKCTTGRNGSKVEERP